MTMTMTQSLSRNNTISPPVEVATGHVPYHTPSAVGGAVRESLQESTIDPELDRKRFSAS